MPSFKSEDALWETLEAETDDFTQAIEREVEQAACEPFGGFTVVRLGDAIVLHGHCRTYHSSLVAHQAALDLIGDTASLIDLILVQ